MSPQIPLAAVILYLFIYFIMASGLTHNKCYYIQETSIAILLGLIIGAIVFTTTQFFQNQSKQSQQFIRNIVFLVLLPPIMFQDGYNFPKRKFFQNLTYINLYGLLGTFLNFVVVWGLLYIFNKYNLFVSVTDFQEPIVLYNWQILLLSAALCSIEPIVTQKIVDKERYPKLFSIIFGQSLFKDTIAITLFDSILELTNDNTSLDFDIGASEIGFIIARFLEVVICSILIGVFIGFITTFLFRKNRFLVEEKGISEMALTILGGYLSYILSQWGSFSGVISMLFCGIIMSHYNIYNLTDEGQSATLMMIEVLKIMAAGMIFFFIGFQIYSVQSFESTLDGQNKSTFSITLLLLVLFSLIIGRVINIYFMSFIGWLFTGSQKWKINHYEYMIIFLAGLIHGAVPFALSVTIPYIDTSPTSNCTQLTLISVVLLTSLIVNIFSPKLQKTYLKKMKDMPKNHPSVIDSFCDNPNTRLLSKQTIMTDNMTGSGNVQKNFIQKYWKKFQQGFFKPFFIFDYEQRRTKIKMDKIRKRAQQHSKFIIQSDAQPENILNADDEAQNNFYEVQLSNHSDSQSSEEGVIKIKVNRQKTNKKQMDITLKKQNKKFETEGERYKSGMSGSDKSKKNIKRFTQTQIMPLSNKSKSQFDINIQQK